jgi:hypothetical protein
VAAVAGGLLDHVGEGVSQDEGHVGAPSRIVEGGFRDNFSRPFALLQIGLDEPGKGVSGIDGEGTVLIVGPRQGGSSPAKSMLNQNRSTPARCLTRPAGVRVEDGTGG